MTRSRKRSSAHRWNATPTLPDLTTGSPLCSTHFAISVTPSTFQPIQPARWWTAWSLQTVSRTMSGTASGPFEQDVRTRDECRVRNSLQEPELSCRADGLGIQYCSEHLPKVG